MTDLHDFLIENVFTKLNERQVRYVMWRQKDVFGFGENSMTYRAIAAQEGISVERVRQLTLRAGRIIANRLRHIAETQQSPHVIIKRVGAADLSVNLLMRPTFVYDLGELSVRTLNCLNHADALLVDKLLEKSERELMSVPNFGRKSLAELKALLSQHDLELRKP